MFRLVLLSALVASVSFAQTPVNDQVWVEFGVPVATNGSFKNVIDEEILKNSGIELGVGWKVFGGSPDKGLKGALKNFGLVVGGSSNFTSPFKDYIKTNEKHVTNVDDACYSYDTYREDYYWDDSCYRCTRGSGYCQDDDVYGRDRYVKYESATLVIGGFVPVNVAERLRLEAGANYRWHFMSQGIRDDDLKTSTEGSLGVVAGAAFRVTRNVDFTAAYEYSVKGRKYKAYHFNVRLNLGRYF